MFFLITDLVSISISILCTLHFNNQMVKTKRKASNSSTPRRGVKKKIQTIPNSQKKTIYFFEIFYFHLSYLSFLLFIILLLFDYCSRFQSQIPVGGFLIAKTHVAHATVCPDAQVWKRHFLLRTTAAHNFTTPTTICRIKRCLQVASTFGTSPTQRKSTHSALLIQRAVCRQPYPLRWFRFARFRKRNVTKRLHPRVTQMIVVA